MSAMSMVEHGLNKLYGQHYVGFMSTMPMVELNELESFGAGVE